MRQIVVSLFPDEATAHQGASALKQLHRQGDIKLHAAVVVGRDARGATTILASIGRGWAGTLGGLAVGSLIDLLGGLSGLVVGAYLGAVAGLLLDLYRSRIGAAVEDAVAIGLEPGASAILADIDESWTVPVDARMAALGAITLRREPTEILDTFGEDVEQASARLASLH
ncbi:MAG TPA: hypothetical protein VMP67_12810 [Candidatus Limnocylindria bacterium]|nr:hypothetical protein [Candidatus Limnocylindria bacterium]